MDASKLEGNSKSSSRADGGIGGGPLWAIAGGLAMNNATGTPTAIQKPQNARTSQTNPDFLFMTSLSAKPAAIHKRA
jgi:hypothetical protein